MIKFKSFVELKECVDGSSEELDEHLKRVGGKWALVSKTTGKPLVYYKGEGKPSDEWKAEQERRIQYFKSKC
jgi:hypothetical protein